MHYFILLLMLLSVGNAAACDICGSNTSNTVVDINGSQPKSYLQYSIFTKRVNFQDPTNDLDYSIMWGQMLTGAYSPHKKVEIKTIVPLLFLHNKMHSSTHQRNWGLGDILVQTSYQLFERKPFENKQWAHILTVSGGIELPTGSYAISEDPLLSNISFGSKSFDFLIGSAYRLSKFKGSLTTGILAKINTANQQQMLYGNGYSWYGQGSYELSSKSHKIQALAGMRYDFNERNILRNIYQTKSGGQVIQSMAGIQGTKNQWTWNINYLQPLWQKNGRDAFLHRATVLASVQYQFKKKLKS